MKIQSIMEIQQLAGVGRLLNMEGEELHNFIRTEQALAREERIRVREEKKEDDEKMAAEVERIRQQRMEDEDMIRQHVKEVLLIQVAADRIRVQETSMSREMNDSVNRPRNSGRSPKLPVFCDGKDDMDAYLQIFERYAENEGWEAGCYGTYLGTLLSGKSLEVYTRLPASEVRDYYKLKEALLIHYQLTH